MHQLQADIAAAEPRKVADPTLLQRFHMTEEDQKARVLDVPERMHAFAGGLPHFDPADAASFIYDAIFAPDAPNSIAKVRVHRAHYSWGMQHLVRSDKIAARSHRCAVSPFAFVGSQYAACISHD